MSKTIHTLFQRIKNRVENGQIAIVALDLVISILVLILVVYLFITVDNIHSDFTSSVRSENSFIWSMEGEQYGNLISMYRQNLNAKGSAKNLKDYEYVGKYAFDAFFYRVFLQQGDMERADEYLQKMEEDSAGMGDYGLNQKFIDKKLGL